MNLYTSLAEVYHEMYQDLFDYKSEFDFYHSFLSRYGARKITEYGCGTGNLAAYFTNHQYEYTGIDLNQEMLDIANRMHPEITFLCSDMSTHTSEVLQDAVFITGRSISYLERNEQIEAAFKSMNVSLREGGLLIFDAIDANTLFESFDESEKELIVGNYKRLSLSKPNQKNGWTWDWYSSYFIRVGNEYKHIGDDFATVRAFEKDELVQFTSNAGLELIDIIPKSTYTWKDHYFVFKKR